MRIPAAHFDEARAEVRKIAKTVEQDTIEAHDVTRESLNQEAALRNARAEEAQYLAISEARRGRKRRFGGELQVSRGEKIGWLALRSTARMFFPGSTLWLQRLVQSRAT
jgi:Domain of unknown function (DUF4349)